MKLFLCLLLTGCAGFNQSPAGKTLARAGNALLNGAFRLGEQVLLEKIRQGQAQASHKQLEGLRK